MSPEAQAFQEVALLFEELGVGYCIVGSVAAYTHGYGRATIDVDVIVADLEKTHAHTLAQRLEEGYYVSREAIADAVLRGGSFNLIHHATGFKIDIFVRSDSVYERQVLQRRELSALFEDEEPQFYVESVEDVVLSKLRWFNMSGQSSERQWNDVQGVLKVNSFDLDFAYLDHWAAQLNITELLKKALDESGLKENL